MKKSDITGALSSPTGWILAGGLVYVAYKVWDSIRPAADAAARAVSETARAVGGVAGGIANIVEGSNPKISRLPDPVAPSDFGFLSAKIVEPPRRAAGAWDQLVKVSINNPDSDRVLELRVRITYYSNWFDKQMFETAGNVLVPAGRTLYSVTVAQPTVLSSAYDGIAQVMLNGEASGFPQMFKPV